MQKTSSQYLHIHPPALPERSKTRGVAFLAVAVADGLLDKDTRVCIRTFLGGRCARCSNRQELLKFRVVL